MPALRCRDAAGDLRWSPRSVGGHRHLSRLSVFLVRCAREYVAHAWIDAGALPRHRREVDEASAQQRRAREVSTMQRPAATDARHAAFDAIRVLELPEWSRAPDQLFRLPPRKGLHPSTDAAPDRPTAGECRFRELRELRWAGSFGQGGGLLALWNRALDARHEAGGEAGRAAAEGRAACQSARRSVVADRAVAGTPRDRTRICGHSRRRPLVQGCGVD